jgi:hypothetical protein
MIDNATFAAELAPLIEALAGVAANTSSENAFATALTAALNAWNVQVSTGALSSNVTALITQVQSLINQFLAIGVKGTVDTVADLPPGAPNGSAYIVETGASAGHGFARINGNWIDIGSLQGQPGVDGEAATVGVGTVTSGAPGSAASVTNVGSPSAAVFDFIIPQGAQGATLWTPIKANATLAINSKNAIDVRTAAVTLTLPALSTMTPGQSVVVADAFGASATNAISVQAAGSDTLSPGGFPFTLSTQNGTVSFIAWLDPGSTGTATGWVAVNGA